MDTLPRRDRLLLLAVLGTGVFLAGLELMITAVALPAIVIDLADWTRLREASWIINGYLLVYVVTMPLAGRLADLWGNRRLFLAALVLFTVGSLLAGLAPSLELLVAARLVQAVGRRHPRPGGDVGGHPPVRRRHAPPGAGRHRRADVPRHGRRAVPGRRRSSGRSTRRRRCRGSGSRRRARSPTSSCRPGAGCSTSTCRSGSSRSPSRGPPAAAGRRRGGRAGSTSSGRSCSRCSCSARSAR